MENNSTLISNDGLKTSTHVTLSYSDEPLFEPALAAPRRSTIERLKQFARAAYSAPAVPELAIVLN